MYEQRTGSGVSLVPPATVTAGIAVAGLAGMGAIATIAMAVTKLKRVIRSRRERAGNLDDNATREHSEAVETDALLTAKDTEWVPPADGAP